jgi:hypothetical protein
MIYKCAPNNIVQNAQNIMSTVDIIKLKYFSDLKSLKYIPTSIVPEKLFFLIFVQILRRLQKIPSFY